MKKYFKTDGQGDSFSKKYGVYHRPHVADIYDVEDVLDQLEKNYEAVFGWVPDRSELTQALEFVELFLAEIRETSASSLYAKSAARLDTVLLELKSPNGGPVRVAEQIAAIKTVR